MNTNLATQLSTQISNYQNSQPNTLLKPRISITYSEQVKEKDTTNPRPPFASHLLLKDEPFTNYKNEKLVI